MPTISSTDEPARQPEAEAIPPATVCPLCGGLGYVREDVPVGHPNFGKLFPCRCKLAEMEQQRLGRLRALSHLEHLSHLTFDTFLPEGHGLSPEKASSLREAYEVARQYADDPRGWLVLLGVYGCGKTHLAAAIANRVVERGLPVLFVAVPDLLDHLRATFAPHSPVTYDERFDEVRNSPLLILDDLGTQSSTPWALEKLFQIFNYRYNAHLPTVITSNQRLEEIDQRIRSRLVDTELARVVPIRALDFRGSGTDQDQSDLSSLGTLQDMTFDTFDPRDDLPAEEWESLRHAFEVCYAYAQHPDGWLVLTGDYGCGKTHLAASVANARVALGEPALFVVVPDLLDHLRATFSPTSQVRFDKRFEEVKTAPLLVLDDLGTENASPWAQEKLFQLFNYRYVTRLPTLITLVDTRQARSSVAQSAESRAAGLVGNPIDSVEPRLRTRMLDRQRCRILAIMAPSYRGTPQRQSARKGQGRSGSRGKR